MRYLPCYIFDVDDKRKCNKMIWKEVVALCGLSDDHSISGFPLMGLTPSFSIFVLSYIFVSNLFASNIFVSNIFE